MEDRNRWILLIKDLRFQHNVSILDAERIALSDPQWRRWVERQINTDMRCHRMAIKHIRHNGPNALIERDGDRLKVRNRSQADIAGMSDNSSPSPPCRDPEPEPALPQKSSIQPEHLHGIAGEDLCL
jgi:hypothetical protein